MVLTEATGNSTHLLTPDALSSSQYLHARQFLPVEGFTLGTSGVMTGLDLRSTDMAKLTHVGPGRHGRKVFFADIRTAAHVVTDMMMKMMAIMTGCFLNHADTNAINFVGAHTNCAFMLARA